MLFHSGTPTLIINKEQCINNIQKFADKARQNNIQFRPHFKTHQSKAIGNWFCKFGINKIAVSSVKMAEYFAQNGWKDICIAFPLNIHEIESINKLSQYCSVSITISNTASLEYLKKLNSNVSIWIEINTGYNRSGIDADNVTELDIVEKTLSKTTKTIQGIISHFGNTYNTKSKSEIEEIYKHSKSILLSLKKRFSAFSTHFQISIGDTPGISLINDLSWADEMRPGNFIFYDVMQQNLGSCSFSEIAITLACPIVDINIERNEIVIYGGAVHLSKEFIIVNNKPCYGLIVTFDKQIRSAPIPNCQLVSLSQEHGIISVPTNTIKQFKIGDIIGILPVHSCLTANLCKGYYTASGKPYDHFAQTF